MSNFLLYHKRDKNFPVYAESGGEIFDINADFRNILRIFAMLRDYKIPEGKRIELLIEWFYITPPPQNARRGILLEIFANFVNPRNNKNGNTETNEDAVSEQRFCYDFDAEEIYAGFTAEYGIDLVEAEFLHWYKFKTLLANLSGDSTFKKKIELRFTDLSQFTGKLLADMTAAKEAVQIPGPYTETEEEKLSLKDSEEFENIWGKVGIK